MPKLRKPDFIIFVGATLYKDIVQRAHLERAFPYIKDATKVDKFPTYSKELIDEVIKILKYKKIPTAMFVMSKFFNKVTEVLEKEYKLEAIEKENSKIYTVNGTYLIVKNIEIFKPIKSYTISNRNISNFKIFGKEDALQKLEDSLCEHASVIKVLPTWYNIEIKDSQGEAILINLAKELNIKVLPIRSLRTAIIKYLSAKNKTLSCAESCTGGLLVAKLIAVSGASEVIEGSMVTYSNKIKQEWLGVKEETLRKYGAVSSECVSEMLDGIMQKANSDISIAISGIAGPTGGTPEKPVGTVYIGVKNRDKKTIKKYHFNGDRNFIQELAARSALEMFIYSEPEFFEFF